MTKAECRRMPDCKERVTGAYPCLLQRLLDGISYSRHPRNWKTLGKLTSVREALVNRVKSSIADCNSNSAANFLSSSESAMLVSVSTAICLPSPEVNIGCTTMTFTSCHPVSSIIPYSFGPMSASAPCLRAAIR